MKKVILVNLKGLSILTKAEQKKITGGYWDNQSGYFCDAKPCEDLGMPSECRERNGEKMCYYWIED